MAGGKPSEWLQHQPLCPLCSFPWSHLKPTKGETPPAFGRLAFFVRLGLRGPSFSSLAPFEEMWEDLRQALRLPLEVEERDERFGAWLGEAAVWEELGA